jgi:hypothetical protein
MGKARGVPEIAELEEFCGAAVTVPADFCLEKMPIIRFRRKFSALPKLSSGVPCLTHGAA